MFKSTLATADPVTLSPPHAPKEASIAAFEQVLPALKHELVKLRHEHNKHEPEYFRLVADLPNEQLTSFDSSSLTVVRVGSTAYGLHLICKVAIPAQPGAYIHVRIFVGAEDGTEEERVAKLHSIHTEEVVREDGDHVFRAIFGEGDELEWFET